MSDPLGSRLIPCGPVVDAEAAARVHERVSEADLQAITRVYTRVIRGFFAQS